MDNRPQDRDVTTAAAAERPRARPLRVLQMIDSIGVGGAERLVARLATLDEPTIDVTVVTLRASPDDVVAADLRAAGRPVLTFPMTTCDSTTSSWRGSAPLQMLRLVRFVRNGRFDVIHTHLNASDMVGAAVGRVCGVPVVSTQHTVGRRVSHRLRHRVRRLTLRRIAEVVAVGHTVAEEQRTALGEQSVTVIPNPAPPPQVRASRAAMRRQLGVSPRGPLLVAAGRLEPPKDHQCMIEAIASVVPVHPDAVLLLLGNGSCRDAVAARVRALGLSESVRLLGLRDDVADVLGAADLFISSSAWEGMPLAILEAMSAGLPVVATDVGDCRAVLGDTGVIVPPRAPAALAEAINSLLADPARAARLGQAAKQRALTDYGLDQWVSRLVAVYRRVATAPTP